MINRGAAAFQEAFDKRVTTLRGRRAKNREIFDKYVEDAVASGRRVDAKELASFANQISGGDSYLTGEIPQGEILTAFTDRANARVEIKEMEERLANFERNKKEANILVDFQLQNFDMTEEDFTQAGEKQFGKYFGELMQRVGGFQGLKERNRDAIMKKATSDSRFQLIKKPGDAEKIFKEIKDPIILANLNNVGQQRADEKFNEDRITIIDYLDKVPEVDLRNPDSKTALISMAMSRVVGGTPAERAKLERIATDHLGMRMGSATKEFARVEQVKLDARQAAAIGNVVKTLMTQDLSTYDENALRGIITSQLKAAGLKSTDEGFEETVNATLQDFRSQRGFAVDANIRKAARGQDREITRLTAMNSMNLSDDQINERFTSYLTSIGLNANDLDAAQLQRLKDPFVSELKADREADKKQYRDKATNAFKQSIGTQRGQELMIALSKTPQSQWATSGLLGQLRNLAPAEYNLDINNLAADPIVKAEIEAIGAKARVSFIQNRNKSLAAQRGNFDKIIDDRAKNTKARVEVMLQKNDPVAPFIGPAVVSGDYVLTLNQESRAVTLLRTAVEEHTQTNGQPPNEAEGVLLAQQMIQQVGGKTRAQLIAEQENLLGGHPVDTDMQAATQAKIDDLKNTLFNFPSAMRAAIDSGKANEQGMKNALKERAKKMRNRIAQDITSYPVGVYKNTEQASALLDQLDAVIASIDNVPVASPPPPPPRTVNFRPNGTPQSQGQAGQGQVRPNLAPARRLVTPPPPQNRRSGSGQIADPISAIQSAASSGSWTPFTAQAMNQALASAGPNAQSRWNVWQQQNPYPPRSNRQAQQPYRRRRAQALLDILNSSGQVALNQQGGGQI